MQLNTSKKLLIAALLLAGFGLETGYGWGGSRLYRRYITLSPATTSANYQLLVTLGTTNFNYAHAATNGGDLLFTDTSDGALTHWIENWNTNGESKLWVKVPATNTATLRLYYGDPSITDGGTAASNIFVRIIGETSQPLRGSWHFDETSGTNVYDTSGYTNTGYAIVASITDGKYGNARYFPGGTTIVQTINIGDAPSCNFSNSDFSIEAWIKPTTNQNNAGCVVARYNGTPLWYMRVNSGLTFASRMHTAEGSNYEASSGSIATSVWTHVVVTYDRDGNMTRYANGAIFGSAMDVSSAYGLSMWSSYRLQIGSLSTLAIPDTQQIFGGAIDEVKVYECALTTDEIADLYTYCGYTTTNYSRRVLLRNYATPEPGASLSMEIRFDRGTLFSTK